MKSKLFALLMLASLFMLVAPVMSYDPDPPEPDPVIVSFDPQIGYKLWGPCCESRIFNTTLEIWNIEANEENLYAWDFYVGWKQDYLELVDHELLFPDGWVEGVDYFVAFDEAFADGPTYDYWHVGVTKIANETGFVGDYLALVWLEFHVIYEPVWHIGCVEADVIVSVTYPATFVKWTPECGAPLEWEYDGDLPVDINPSRPNMEITFSDTSALEPKKASGWINQSVLTAYLWVSNVTKLFDIKATITWDPYLLHLDIQQVTINEEAFPMPWERLDLSVSTESGQIDFYIKRPTEKTPLKGTFWILQMDFKVNCYEDDEFPIDGYTLIQLWGGDASKLSFYDPEYGEWWYFEGDAEAGADCPHCIKFSDAEYFWLPIGGDFDQDGHVSVIDIGIMADHYGCNGLWDVVGDDDIVDIYDIVWVAKRFCTSEPRPIPDP